MSLNISNHRRCSQPYHLIQTTLSGSPKFHLKSQEFFCFSAKKKANINCFSQISRPCKPFLKSAFSNHDDAVDHCPLYCLFILSLNKLFRGMNIPYFILNNVIDVMAIVSTSLGKSAELLWLGAGLAMLWVVW